MKPGPLGMPAVMQGLDNNPLANPPAVGVSFMKIHGHFGLYITLRRK